ncbi:hypothetical protein HYS79_00575 [Patescibacteria group bacterium]|nr:hypothetical protein [Patescibacteria group bacterium]
MNKPLEGAMTKQPTKDIRVEVSVRNNLLLTAMEERGIKSVKELWRQLGVPASYSQLALLAAMKIAARKNNGDWLGIAHRLADFFRCLPEDLFSEPQQYEALKKNRARARHSFALWI